MKITLGLIARPAIAAVLASPARAACRVADDDSLRSTASLQSLRTYEAPCSRSRRWPRWMSV